MIEIIIDKSKCRNCGKCGDICNNGINNAGITLKRDDKYRSCQKLVNKCPEGAMFLVITDAVKVAKSARR